MNVKNILCPVDFSDQNDAAIQFASTLAKEHDAEIHLVHVHEELHLVDTGFGGYPATDDIDAARQMLDDVSPSPGVRYRRRFIVGHPVNELVKYTETGNIDLIVMATHGRTGLARMLMGSIAEALVRKSPCPVLTIKHPARSRQESTT